MMKKWYQLLSLSVVSISMVAVSGCAASSKSSMNKLVSDGGISVTLPNDYINAYANTKDYYNKCVSHQGVTSPITVNTNGVTVTTMNQQSSTTVSSNLDRSQQRAVIEVYMGRHAKEHMTFQPNGNNGTLVKYYGDTAGLRSKTFNDKRNQQRVNRLRKVSQTKVQECLKLSSYS